MENNDNLETKIKINSIKIEDGRPSYDVSILETSSMPDYEEPSRFGCSIGRQYTKLADYDANRTAPGSV